jgi:hypothetical protein
LFKIQDEIFKFLDDIANNDEDAKALNFDNIAQSTFNVWLQGFKIENPSDYFKDYPDNTDLVQNILSEQQFLIKTLELFGLPADYMTGNGHWATWTKESVEGKDKKKGKGKKDTKKKNQF